ncbi:MAG: hypothetical protein ACOX8V_01605 [Thermoleophilia bacterium]
MYASTGRTLRWDPFFVANLDRWQFVQDCFLTDFKLTPAFGLVLGVGILVCLLTAMLRGPYFRAIAGPGYPLAPRNSREAARLSLFYVFSHLVLWVLPFAGASGAVLEQIIAFVVLVVAILIIFADYVIVFEDVGMFTALKRSFHLVIRRWIAVLLIFIILQLVYLGLHELYRLYYQNRSDVLVALPVVQIILDAFIALVADLVLVSLYRQLRLNDHV